MNVELIEVTSEFILDRITEWCSPLTFEEYLSVLEHLSKDIQLRLDSYCDISGCNMSWQQEFPVNGPA
jgi:hypothetical protein